MNHRIAAFGRGFGLLAFVAGSLAVAVLAVPLAEYEEGNSASVGGLEASTVEVVVRQTQLVTPASVSLEWTDEREVLSASSGTVTAVHSIGGTDLKCGAMVLEVASEPVVAYCGPRPVSSAISSTTKSRDGAEFFLYLRDLGLVADASALSQQERRDILRWWQGGVGQVSDGVVEPEDLLWIGKLPFAPTSIFVTPGQILQLGEAVLGVEPRIALARFATELVLDGNPPWVFGLDGSEERFEVTNSAVTDLSGLEVVARELGSLEDGLPRSLSGTLRLSTPASLPTVPASTIVTSADGSTCVIGISQGLTTPIPIDVVESNVGTVFVRGELSSGDEIVSAPGATASC